jgi:serine/threonine-protein kinase
MDNYINKVLDGRYEIIEIIGTGGMAVVYKARDTKLNRLVAVKILKSEHRGDIELRRRFRAESEAVAGLNHPNIINVFDVSTNKDIDYFVMELIDGITLKQYIKHRRVLTVKEALHFTVQILKGLEHAHAKKIVHRDIKPQNIMILRDGTTKVTDFGIARIAGNQDLTVNQENAFGTVHYIAPEQARCEAIDGRADIYAVGVMLYEMLTGVLPYEGDNAVAIAMQHIKSTPRPPREINPEIPAGVEYIILKAMCGDISKRYKTAGEMIDDIDAFRRNPAEFAPAESDGEPAETGDTIRFFTPRDTQNSIIVRQDKVPAVKRSAAAPKDKKLRLMPILAALFALMVFLAMAAALWITIVSPTPDVKDVIVPDLLGRTYENVINDKSLDFEFVVVDRKYDSTYEKDVIIKQDQLAGSTVKAGSTIKLTLSLGKLSASMPDYTNTLYAEAYANIKSLMQDSITVKRVQEASDTITEGYVIRTNPARDQIIVAGQTVTFYVSAGPEIEMVEVPNLIDMRKELAEAELISKGFTIGDIEYQENDEYESGTVIGQSIEPQAKVPKGTEIILTVSIRSTPETTLPPTEATEPPATEPTEPPVNTTVWTLTLPQGAEYPEEFVLKVYKDGELVFSNTVSKSDRTINITISGTGSVIMKAFINDNDEPWREEMLNLT